MIMKKLLGIVVLCFLLNGNAYADFKLNSFNKWLYDNGHHEFVTKAESEDCKSQPEYTQIWYLKKCDQVQFKNNLKIKFYDSWIPEEVEKQKFAIHL